MRVRSFSRGSITDLTKRVNDWIAASEAQYEIKSVQFLVTQRDVFAAFVTYE